MDIIALIPARSGSKGVKDKNVKQLNGHPPIAYSIKAAQKVKAIESILDHPEVDSLRSVQIAKQNPYKMWFIEKGLLKPILQIKDIKESYNMPRQKLPRTYSPNGTLDITRPRTVLEKQSMTGGKILAFEVNELIYGLDYPEDIPEIEKTLEVLEQDNYSGDFGEKEERFPS